MYKELPFMIFCLEEYKNAKNMTGKEVVKLFTNHYVFDYIKEFYEALHTTGRLYIIEDIDLFLKARNVVV